MSWDIHPRYWRHTASTEKDYGGLGSTSDPYIKWEDYKMAGEGGKKAAKIDFKGLLSAFRGECPGQKTHGTFLRFCTRVHTA
jgi:hypothetical protein